MYRGLHYSVEKLQTNYATHWNHIVIQFSQVGLHHKLLLINFIIYFCCTLLRGYIFLCQCNVLYPVVENVVPLPTMAQFFYLLKWSITKTLLGIFSLDRINRLNARISFEYLTAKSWRQDVPPRLPYCCSTQVTLGVC